MDKIRLNALAECGDPELDDREEVQPVTASMILGYIRETNQLPAESAGPFSRWLHGEWFSFNEEGDATVGEVISGALSQWCGGREDPEETEKRVRERTLRQAAEYLREKYGVTNRAAGDLVRLAELEAQGENALEAGR